MSLFQIVSKKNRISNMKAIKILTIVAIAASILAVVPTLVYYMIKLAPDREYIIYIFFPLMVLNIAIGGLTLIRMKVDSKSLLWGILTLIFVISVI